MEPNDTTIKAYNKAVDTYILKTPSNYQSYHKPMLNWINAALEGLKGKAVFEIGSATPRDANYIRSKGFTVQTSDATEKFVQHLQAKGDNTILFNALDDPMPNQYDLIFANAVVPHFTYEDVMKFLDRIYEALSVGGRLAFNVKIGHGENWINEKFEDKRFIHYWQPENIKKVLEDRGFKFIFFEANVAGDLPTHHWVNIVVEK